MESWILTIVIFTPLVGGVLLMLPPYGNDASVRRSALFYSLLTLGISLFALFKFYEGAPANSYNDPAYLLSHRAPWNTGELIDIDGLLVPSIDIAYHVGVDGISIWLVVLATLLMPLAILSGFCGIRTRVREYHCLLLFLETGLLGVFCAMDLLFFYVCFEFTLIPLYFVIGIWGGVRSSPGCQQVLYFHAGRQRANVRRRSVPGLLFVHNPGVPHAQHRKTD